MDVMGLEGDLAVPQISFLPTHKIPPSGRPPGPLQPVLLVLPSAFPRGGQGPPLSESCPVSLAPLPVTALRTCADI